MVIKWWAIISGPMLWILGILFEFDYYYYSRFCLTLETKQMMQILNDCTSEPHWTDSWHSFYKSSTVPLICNNYVMTLWRALNSALNWHTWVLTSKHIIIDVLTENSILLNFNIILRNDHNFQILIWYLLWMSYLWKSLYFFLFS